MGDYEIVKEILTRLNINEEPSDPSFENYWASKEIGPWADFENGRAVVLRFGVIRNKIDKTLGKSHDVLPYDAGELIGDLSYLRELYLHFNNFTDIPESIYKLTNLEILHLQVNKLTSLSENIGNLLKLKTLYLDRNLLTILPESIGRLTELVDLNISSNRLRSLPESFSNLKLLKDCSACNNLISKLPLNIGNLTQIEWFNLESNRIRKLPQSIIKLDRERVELDDNPINIPRENTELDDWYLMDD